MEDKWWFDRILVQPMYERFLMDPNDTPLDIRWKKWLPSLLGLILLFMVPSMVPLVMSKRYDAAAIAFYTGVIVSMYVMAKIFLLKRVQLMDFLIVVAGISICVMLVDLTKMALLAERKWVTMLPTINLLVYMRVPKVFIDGTVGAWVIWLLFTAAEKYVRFGLLDLDWNLLAPYEVRRDYVCSCEHPPCATASTRQQTLFDLGFNLMICAIVNCLARASMRDSEREARTMKKTIDVAHRIASCLAAFDLEAAADELDRSGAFLPDGLGHALRKSLNNLREYQPFIPQSLFAHLREEETARDQQQGAPSAAPGLLTNRCAVSFTDIRGSTALWEACPEAMRRALIQHNDVVRGLIAQTHGYEVKIVGDSFMTTHDAVVDAVNFGLLVHEGLLEVLWPAQLLNQPECQRDDAGLWGGLLVRVAVHCGHLSVEKNHVTDRYDYFGVVVNTTARLMNVCADGATIVSAEAYNEVRGTGTGALPAYVATPMGGQHLKGVAGPVDTYMLHTANLEGRKQPRPRSAHSVHISEPVSPTSSSLFTGLRARSAASVVHVYVRLPPDALVRSDCGTEVMNDMLSMVLSMTDQTNGCVSAVLSSYFTVTWNVARPCHAHLDNSLYFVSRMVDYMETTDLDVSAYAGVSSGSMLEGPIGDRHSTRFISVFGLAVRLAVRLCEDALQDNVTALCGAVDNSLFASVQCAREVLRVRKKLAVVGAERPVKPAQGDNMEGREGNRGEVNMVQVYEVVVSAVLTRNKYSSIFDQNDSAAARRGDFGLQDGERSKRSGSMASMHSMDSLFSGQLV